MRESNSLYYMNKGVSHSPKRTTNQAQQEDEHPLSPLSGTRGLPPASSVSLLSFSLCVAFTASPRHQLSVYMLLALGNTQLSQKPNSKFPGLSQVSNELLLVQLTMAKRHSSSTPQTQPQSVIPWVEGVYGPADDPKLLMG